jgi:hypothetical protein
MTLYDGVAFEDVVRFGNIVNDYYRGAMSELP